MFNLNIITTNTHRLGIVCTVVAAFMLTCFAQTTSIPSRITQAVDNNDRVALPGNTHHLARLEFDRGPAPDSSPADRVLLVLRRSSAQQAELNAFLDEQQTGGSLNFHHWLTPQQFGERFGPSNQDLETVTQWLKSRGFHIEHIAAGRTVIEFSGNAGQVRDTFHTEIHRYQINGENYWANASDPEIPIALAPVIIGIATLHNFPSKPAHNVNGSPQVHELSPSDVATIYNLTPLYEAGIDGSRTSIAVIGDGNLNLQDVIDFRKLFGLPYNPPEIILNGVQPGQLGAVTKEAVLDASWTGAIAPNAAIKFVLSTSTNTTNTQDLSEEYIVENNLADVVSESLVNCEHEVTAAHAAELAQFREQAAAQGMTFVVSTGDSGPYGCANFDTAKTVTNSDVVSVNARASSPYVIAVGGTQFDEGSSAQNYWAERDNAVYGSALRYVPEHVWNDSCPESGCTNSNIRAGSGGSSTIFERPSWQIGVPGIPSGSYRLIPDVSMTASGDHDPYMICLNASCQPDNQGHFQFAVAGGTSASTPAFAGIMALVVQRAHSRLGNANYVLYKLAAAEDYSQCNGSDAGNPPASNCIFNDITLGSNAVSGEPGAGTSTAKFQAGFGYDLATGLGSVNAANLATAWVSPRSIPTVSLSASSPGGQPGASATFTATVTANMQMPVPGGTVTFFTVVTKLGTQRVTGGVNSQTGFAEATAALTVSGECPVDRRN